MYRTHMRHGDAQTNARLPRTRLEDATYQKGEGNSDGWSKWKGDSGIAVAAVRSGIRALATCLEQRAARNQKHGLRVAPPARTSPALLWEAIALSSVGLVHASAKRP